MLKELTIGIAQTAPEPTTERNRDKIIHFVHEARARGCRLLVTQEGALYSAPDTPKAQIDAAVHAVRAAAAESGIYVILCLFYRLTDDAAHLHNRLLVIAPDGGIIHCYDKIWGDARFASIPGPFLIDEVLCCAAICADRQVRGVEELPAFAGARILFECSGNFAREWIPDLQYFWYVPRAVRNGAYVILANMPRGKPEMFALGLGPGHGHSAVIAPDGTLVAGLGDENDRLLVATIDPARATLAEAERRHAHPIFRRFWDAGLAIMGGADVVAPPLVQRAATGPRNLTVAAAQMAVSSSLSANLERMGRLVEDARQGGADVVAFPELAVTGVRDEDVVAADGVTLEAALGQVREMARRSRICAVFGMPHIEDGRRHNSAYAVGPAGEILTRYDQLVVDRPGLFAAGQSTRAMWFDVKGKPAVVTIGQDALWNEIAELAAVRGAQLHFHLCYDGDTSEEGLRRRKQLWANVACFRTLTATVNAASPASGGSTIWQDYYRGQPPVGGGFTPHWPVRLVDTGAGEAILYATLAIPRVNHQYAWMTDRSNPQMRSWYLIGADVICDEI